MDTVMLESQSGLSMASLGEAVSAAAAALIASKLKAAATRSIAVAIWTCDKVIARSIYDIPCSDVSRNNV